MNRGLRLRDHHPDELTLNPDPPTRSMSDSKAPGASGVVEAPHPGRRWVLVAGTGLLVGTPRRAMRMARAVGRWLARYRYGLVSGGWHGVDYAVTHAFVAELAAQGQAADEYLIQVLPHQAPVQIEAGRLVRTPPGEREWLEPQKYADAVVLIGGLGGTYYTWIGALHDGLPRFPLGGTGGDAGRAHRETLDLWSLVPVPGLTRSEFESLGRPVPDEESADALARQLVGDFLVRSLAAADARSRGSGADLPSLFISYSRRDAGWVDRLRTLFAPLERRGVLATWSDADLRSGSAWSPQIQAVMERATAALLLVTPALLASQYVRRVELPFLEARARAPGSTFHLFWVLLESCAWDRELPALAELQAIGDAGRAVDQSENAADEQVRLIEVVKEISAALQPRPASEAPPPAA